MHEELKNMNPLNGLGHGKNGGGERKEVERGEDERRCTTMFEFKHPGKVEGS